MIYYFLLILATALFSSQFLLNQLFCSFKGSSAADSLLFTLYTSLAGFFIVFIINGFRLELSLFSVLIALIYSVVNLLYNAASLKAFETVNLSVYSVFSMLGGMLLPSVFGIFYSAEAMTVQKLICFIFISAALFLTIDRKARKSKKAYFYYAAVFVLNGSVGVLSVIHQSGSSAVDSFSFLMQTRLISFFFSAIGFALKYRAFPRITMRPLLCCVAFTAMCSLGNLFLLISLKHIDASVQYPIVTGGVMLFSLIISLIRKEKVTKKEALSTLVAFLSTLLIIM